MTREDYAVFCETCGHYFLAPEVLKNLGSSNIARRLPAKARLKAFHWYHKVSNKLCECCHECGCK